MGPKEDRLSKLAEIIRGKMEVSEKIQTEGGSHLQRRIRGGVGLRAQ